MKRWLSFVALAFWLFVLALAIDASVRSERVRAEEIRAEGFKQGACSAWDRFAVLGDLYGLVQAEAGEYCDEAGWVWSWDAPHTEGAKPEGGE